MDIDEKIDQFRETFILGSSQYETIGAVLKYALYNKLTPQQLANELGYKLTKYELNIPDNWLEDFYSEYMYGDGDRDWLPPTVNQFLKDNDIDYVPINTDDENAKILSEKLQDMTPALVLLDMCRYSAWDLWSAGPCVSGYLISTDFDYGSGEIENKAIGLLCYMLMYTGAIKDITHFSDFDT